MNCKIAIFITSIKLKFLCKVNKLTSDSEEKVVACTSFYAFLAKMVGKHAKTCGILNRFCLFN